MAKNSFTEEIYFLNENKKRIIFCNINHNLLSPIHSSEEN